MWASESDVWVTWRCFVGRGRDWGLGADLTSGPLRLSHLLQQRSWASSPGKPLPTLTAWAEVSQRHLLVKGTNKSFISEVHGEIEMEEQPSMEASRSQCCHGDYFQSSQRPVCCTGRRAWAPAAGLDV